MTPSAQRAAAVAAKAKSLETKTEENKRAYQRRKYRELAKLSGIHCYETHNAEATRTPACLKWKNIGHRKEKLETINNRLPDAEIKSMRREWIETEEDKAEVRRILAKK